MNDEKHWLVKWLLPGAPQWNQARHDEFHWASDHYKGIKRVGIPVHIFECTNGKMVKLYE